MTKETRIYKLESIEARQAHDGQPATITGYAAVFNARSHDLGGFVEEVLPGAFSDTLAAGPDVRATVDHSGGLTTLGRTTSGTLALEQDDNGLRVSIQVPDTQAGRDALTLVNRGDINQMSFMFRVPKGGDEWLTNQKPPLRRLKRVDLNDGDVAIVTYPAYPQTSAEARDMAAALAQVGDDAAQNAEDEAARLQVRQANRRRRLEIYTTNLEVNDEHHA